MTSPQSFEGYSAHEWGVTARCLYHESKGLHTET